MEQPGSESQRSSKRFIVLAFVLLLLPFLPLLLSVAEHSLFGTNKVEDFFGALGLANLLGRFYRPIVRLFTR
jgi:hypothetical protein